MTAQVPEPNPLADVEVGMPVIDRENEQVGTVAALKFGDRQAITAEGQRIPRGLAGMVVDSFTGSEPDVPRQLAEKLLRTGYIKIDAKGLFSTDLYAGADQVDHVAADGVRLAVPRHHLVPES